MHKYFAIGLSVFLVIVFTPLVSAQETDVMTTTTAIGTETSDTPSKTPQRSANSLTQVKDAAKEKAMTAREEFKQKLAEIKDQRKLTILTNLDTKFSEINTRRTTQLSERVGRLSSILDNITARGVALKADGENTTTLNVNISAAQKALDAAELAVSTQAEKDYIVNVTTETALKNAASTIVQQFITDLKTTHKSVVDAQVAVKKAHTELVKLSGEPSTTPGVTVAP